MTKSGIKIRKLFLLIIFMLVFFGINVKNHFVTNKTSTKSDNTFPKSTVILNRSERPTAVFIITQCRSGSSILGELFNQESGVTYLYEPLYPFREKNCLPVELELEPLCVKAVEEIAHCNFEDLPAKYRTAFKTTKQTDAAGCLSHNICFSDCAKCSKFLTRDAPEIVNVFNTVNVAKLSQFCKQSNFVAAKLNYLRSIESIQHLLYSTEINVKIIHLVRDPRAIVRSLFRANPSTPRSPEQFRLMAEQVCKRLLWNTKYAENVLQNSSSYIRIRHEDFSLRPLESLKSLYKFIEKVPTQKLVNWLLAATSSSKNSGEFSTNRKSTEVIHAWRKWFEVEEVNQIEETCSEVFSLLRYNRFLSNYDMNNLNLSSFEKIP